MSSTARLLRTLTVYLLCWLLALGLLVHGVPAGPLVVVLLVVGFTLAVAVMFARAFARAPAPRYVRPEATHLPDDVWEVIDRQA